MPYLRLRQVCLVAAKLAPAAAAIEARLGLRECYRDPNVAKYGLENVLFPIGTDFLEIVAPTRPGTAAGRFLERHGGRHGYMAIFDCDDPEARGRHCESIGVRVAHRIRHGAYLGVQLHPKDTGAAMIEFNRTEGGEAPTGAYGPAGPDWQGAIRRDVARRMLAIEISAPDPAALEARWAAILQRRPGALDAGAVRFVAGEEEALTGIVVEAADRARAGEVFETAGVRFRLA